MDMHDQRHPTADVASRDELEVDALDGHEPDDETGISAHLLASSAAARREQQLRAAAGEYAAARTSENSPPRDLRTGPGRGVPATRAGTGYASVMAPRSAPDANRAYLASTPDV
jgi:hypothetical protein